MNEQESLFELVCRLAVRDGALDLAHKDGLWKRVIDEHWTIYLNAHEGVVPLPGSTLKVQPYCCHVEFNGWPAGAFNPWGGWIAAGSLANESTFAAAVERCLEAAS